MSFYKLTSEEFLRINPLLKDAELRVYLYLCTVMPFDDSQLEIDTAAIAEQLGLTRRTIQRALKRLEELELLDVEIVRARIKRHRKTKRKRDGYADLTVRANPIPAAAPLTDISESPPDEDKATDGSPKRHTDRQRDTRIAETTHGSPKRHMDRQSDTRIAETTHGSPTQAETQSQQGLQNPPDYSDYSDLKQTLSKAQREKFLEFGRKKAAALPRPPQLPDRWIEKNAAELFEQFRRQHPTIAPPMRFEDHPKWHQALESLRRAKFSFIALGEIDCEDIPPETRKAMAQYATANGLLWGKEE